MGTCKVFARKMILSFNLFGHRKPNVIGGSSFNDFARKVSVFGSIIIDG